MLKNLKSHHIHFHVCTNSTDYGSVYCVSTGEYYGCGVHFSIIGSAEGG